MQRRDVIATAALGLTGAAAAAVGADAGAGAADDRDTMALLDRFAEAWNTHDIEGLMACMAPECVFEASAGREVAGTRHSGPDAVRRAYQAVFDAYPDGRWNEPRHFVAGDRAVSEWRFTGTMKDGTKVEVNGCDVFTLKDGRIAIKNSYRKQRG
jgi:ketosteroid isomerase-like protein